MVHVVIADDDDIIRDLLERVVRLLGWTPHTVVNGAQALAMVERLEPDVVIADVGMSGMNGIDLLRALKANPQLARIPVVIMSSMDRETEARESGCAAFIPKPFSLEIMLQILSRLAPTNPPDRP